MVINDTKVAILGGRGMLGTDLTKICGQQGFNVEVFDLPEFDITALMLKYLICRNLTLLTHSS
jgi:dTDP-4-dehydrorhamnose reductase